MKPLAGALGAIAVAALPLAAHAQYRNGPAPSPASAMHRGAPDAGYRGDGAHAMMRRPAYGHRRYEAFAGDHAGRRFAGAPDFRRHDADHDRRFFGVYGVGVYPGGYAYGYGGPYGYAGSYGYDYGYAPYASDDAYDSDDAGAGYGPETYAYDDEDYGPPAYGGGYYDAGPGWDGAGPPSTPCSHWVWDGRRWDWVPCDCPG